MAIQISDSVGLSGKNRPEDVVKVQQLLLQQGIEIGPSDGDCGPRTIAGITAFQSGFLRRADGLVEPAGATMQRLNMALNPITPGRPMPIRVPPPALDATLPGEVNNSITRLVRRDSLGPFNPGLSCTDNRFMVATFGMPRESFSDNDQPVTNQALKKQLVTASVGPFRVTGLRPAVESLTAVMEDIRTERPEMHEALGSAGMLCCRYVRGSKTAISNHSWGTALDLKLNGLLDRRGDGMVQYGLTLIAPIFNRHGWYWGAAFRTEDAMHFEVSRGLLEKWYPG